MNIFYNFIIFANSTKDYKIRFHIFIDIEYVIKNFQNITNNLRRGDLVNTHFKLKNYYKKERNEN